MYVLRVKGQPALGLGFLFDDEWCHTLIQEKFGTDKAILPEQLKDYWMPRLYRAVVDAALIVFEDKAPGCDIYIGENTDPEGHEILVVVPYDMREKVKTIVDALTGCVYETVEELF